MLYLYDDVLCNSSYRFGTKIFTETYLAESDVVVSGVVTENENMALFQTYEQQFENVISSDRCRMLSGLDCIENNNLSN